MGSLNTFCPIDFVYSMDGVAVRSSAIGAPQVLFSPSFRDTRAPTPLQAAMLSYGSSLVDLTQCAPVLKRNPFHVFRAAWTWPIRPQLPVLLQLP